MGDYGGLYSIPLAKNLRVPNWVVPHPWGTLGDKHSHAITCLRRNPKPRRSYRGVRLGGLGGRMSLTSMSSEG